MQFFRSKWFGLIFSASLLCFVLVLAVLYRADLKEVMSQIDLVWFFAGIVCYGCNYVCRALRLWNFTERKMPLFPTFLKITSLHGFNSYFLPFRSGDLTLPFLLHLYSNIPVKHGGRILVRARMLDIVTLGVLVSFTSLFFSANISLNLQLLFFASGMAFIILPYGALFVVRKGYSLSWKRLVSFVGDNKPDFPRFPETCISLTIWFWTGCTVFCVIRSLNIPITFMEVWFLVTIQLPLQLLPVQGFANAGNHEAGWLVALSILGLDSVQALPLVLSSHVVLICYVVLLGGVAAILPSPRIKGDNALPP